MNAVAGHVSGDTSLFFRDPDFAKAVGGPGGRREFPAHAARKKGMIRHEPVVDAPPATELKAC